MCSGYLPYGAEDDSRNPSNEVEVVDFIKCDVYDCYTEVENEGDVCAKCLAESDEIGIQMDTPTCECCGRPAVVLLRFPAVEAYTGSGEKWHPNCADAYHTHLENAEDTNRCEMEQHGGAYGLVTWEEKWLPKSTDVMGMAVPKSDHA